MTDFSIQPPTSLSLDVDRDGDLDLIRQGTFNITEATAFERDGSIISSKTIIDSTVAPVSISTTIGSGNPVNLFKYPEAAEVLRVVGFFDPIAVNGRTGDGGTGDTTRFDLLIGRFGQETEEFTVFLQQFGSFAGYQISDLGLNNRINDNDDVFSETRPVLATSLDDPELAGLEVQVLDDGTDRFYVGYTSIPPSSSVLQGTTRGLGGRGFGDPHLLTFDGLNYDFHAAGEFTLVASTEDDLKVQVRAEHLNNRTTYFTAAATEVDGHRVAFYANENDLLLIDGQATQIAAGDSLQVGAGLITRDQNVYTVTYDNSDGSSDPDQFLVTLQERKNSGDFYFDVETFLADERAGSVEGLLGNKNGTKHDDLALPDGTFLTQPINFTDFYTDFADGWRIELQNSLFDYDLGEDTNTYTEHNFFDNDNTIAGLGFQDYIYGGAGDDQIIGSNSADILDGESGIDTLDYRYSKRGVSVNLATNSVAGGHAQGDLIANFENIYGSKLGDHLTGDRHNNVLNGREGKDILTGGAGKDTFYFKKLGDSKLNSFDQITDLQIGQDQISGVKAVSATDVVQLGSVATLNPAGIQALLTETNFTSYGAATFSYDSRTFLALNNNVEGYSSQDDALIEISGMSGSLADLAIV